MKPHVMIIGGGGAACRAAVAAADHGADVTLLSKRRPGRGGATAYSVAEMAAFNVADGVVDPEDNADRFLADILEAGRGMADPETARVLVEGAPAALRDLENWGVPFERRDERYLEIQACFSSRPRSHVIRGHGEPILRALSAQMKARDIRILDNVTVIQLLVEDGECAGVVYMDDEGNITPVTADAVVLATGGAGQLFEHSFNPPDVCGNGYALAHEAGADLVNMEFLQMGLGICHPVKNILNAWIWSAVPKLTNARGQACLSTYLPSGVQPEQVFHDHRTHFPFSSSDLSRYLEIAVHSEILADRAAGHGGIHLDLRHIDDEFLSTLPAGDELPVMWPITRDYLEQRGIDTRQQTLEIACFAHAVNGGVRINACAETSLPGLYAAGETAGGPHGADRLGGNMMVACQVFGEIAGREAAGYRNTASRRSRTDAPEIRDHAWTWSRDADWTSMQTRLKSAAQQHLMIIRHEPGLQIFSETLTALEEEIRSAPAGHPSSKAWDTHALLTTGALMAKAMRARQESRGSHYRSDFPEPSKAFHKACLLNGRL